METKKTETDVPSFFDIFVAEESVESEVSDIPTQAEFLRDELLLNSLEYFLDIYESEEFDDDDEEEEEDDSDDDDKKKSKKKGDSKKVK